MEDMVSAPRQPAAPARSASRRKPRVLLIGAGRFGQQHLIEWQRLQSQGRMVLAGVVVQSAAHRDALAQRLDVPVYAGFDEAQLAQIDLVDIATPTATHAELVRRCLPHASVLCEKPLCDSKAQAQALQRLAQRHQRLLMSAHLYRHHPVTATLQQLIEEHGMPTVLRAVLTNPSDEAQPGLDPFEEFIHVFDLLHALVPQRAKVVRAWRDGPQASASLELVGGLQAHVQCGWTGVERVRKLELTFAALKASANFIDGVVTETRRDSTRKHWHGRTHVALGRLFENALAAIQGRQPSQPSPDAIANVIGLMAQAQHSANTPVPRATAAPPRHTKRSAQRRPDRPRVGVIGGGVFGSICALELSQHCDVVLCERHDHLLTEASFLNQWRHHSGFHYPRSIETIQEVQSAKADFESEWEAAIRREVTAYYAVSSLGREISRERYLAVCQANQLTFEEVPAPAGLLRADRVSLCLRTDESVIDIDRLTRLLMTRLRRSKPVSLRLGTTVDNVRMLPDGSKRLNVHSAAGREQLDVDFLVNATYANTNLVSRWLGFPLRPMRFDLLEMAVVRIPGGGRIMMTILDAPFTSLTSLGAKDMYLLSHIHHSILASEVTADGMPPRWPAMPSNHQNLMAHGLRYLPILERAQYIESRIGVRTVEAYNDDFDGRPTVVTPHGFGCWSVLGGKVITAVTNAREIARAIARESGLSQAGKGTPP